MENWMDRYMRQPYLDLRSKTLSRLSNDRSRVVTKRIKTYGIVAGYPDTANFSVTTNRSLRQCFYPRW